MARRPDPFAGLTEFLAVAERSSFRAAAAELGVTSAAVSQAVSALERRLGLSLFQRTTRRVSLTESGATLFARLKPVAAEVRESFEAVGELRHRPFGHLRLSVPRMALDLVIAPLLPQFRRAYPDITVEVDVNDAAVDLTAGGFDAGIRIGEALARDMIAIRLTADFQWSVAGSPDYFARRGRPGRPEELSGHECVNFRFPASGILYRWEFERGGRAFSIDVPRGLTVNDSLLLKTLALAGMGLIYTSDLAIADAVAAGTLERVLQPYLPRTPGLYLYFAARGHAQSKLRAFIDCARAFAERRSDSPG